MNPKMTDGLLRTIKDYTGIEVSGCPWSAFDSPFVHEVLTAHKWFDKGQLLTLRPDADRRLMEGVSFFDSARAAVSNCEMQKRLEESKRRRDG